MGIIPPTYYLRQALKAEDLAEAMDFYGHFYRHIWTTSYFIFKGYEDAFRKYAQNYAETYQIFEQSIVSPTKKS